MAEIASLGQEIINTHTTEEVIRFLANTASGITANVRNSEDIEKAVIRNYANIEMVFGIVKQLDAKLNGEKEPVVL